MIPIQQVDVMRWKGKLYVDKALRLRSAPKIFTAVADGLMWVMCEHGVHYLDDYLVLRAQTSVKRP